MKFTFIVCTYNRDAYVTNTLQSLADQTYPKSEYEIVLVNNNSKDNTANVCQQFIDAHKEINITYALELQQGFSFALNRGISEAKGEFIVFVDDDETIDKEYLDILSNYLKQYPDAEMAGTPVVPIYEIEKPKWMSHFTARLISGEFDKGNKVKLLNTNSYPGTGHLILKKELFDRFGTFNTDLGRKGGSLMGAEDKDMCHRLINNNIKCYYFPDIKIYHHIPKAKLTEEFFERLTYSIGKSERIRTQSMEGNAYGKRLFQEWIKWCGTIVLSIWYILTLRPTKGIRLIRFRKNVTKGLLGH